MAVRQDVFALATVVHADNMYDCCASGLLPDAAPVPSFPSQCGFLYSRLVHSLPDITLLQVFRIPVTTD